MTLNRSIDQRSNALCAAKSKFSVKIEIELNCMWFWCIISLLNTQSIHFKWLLNEFSDIKADIMSSWTTSLLALSCDWSFHIEFYVAHNDSVTISIQWCKVIQKNGIQMNSLWCLVQSIVSSAMLNSEHTQCIQFNGNMGMLCHCRHVYTMIILFGPRILVEILWWIIMMQFIGTNAHVNELHSLNFVEWKKTGWTNIRDLVSN